MILEKILRIGGAAYITTSLFTAQACVRAPDAHIARPSHQLDDWQQMFDMEEIARCRHGNSLGDCVLGLVEPDKGFLYQQCGGQQPFSYEIRAGDESTDHTTEPTVLIFCEREDYRQALETGELRSNETLHRLFPNIF
jgi:hypothetical protein